MVNKCWLLLINIIITIIDHDNCLLIQGPLDCIWYVWCDIYEAILLVAYFSPTLICAWTSSHHWLIVKAYSHSLSLGEDRKAVNLAVSVYKCYKCYLHHCSFGGRNKPGSLVWRIHGIIEDTDTVIYKKEHQERVARVWENVVRGLRFRFKLNQYLT